MRCCPLSLRWNTESNESTPGISAATCLSLKDARLGGHLVCERDCTFKHQQAGGLNMPPDLPSLTFPLKEELPAISLFTLVSPLFRVSFWIPRAKAPAGLTVFSHHGHYELQALSAKPRFWARPSLAVGYQMQSLRSHSKYPSSHWGFKADHISIIQSKCLKM